MNIENNHNDALSVWDFISYRWPIANSSNKVSIFKTKDEVEKLLDKKKIEVNTFGHFGFLVKDIGDSISFIKDFDKNIPIEDYPKISWVEKFSLYVARIIINDVELEFISPKGESFFKTSLGETGEKLHHIAFAVDDMEKALFQIRKNKIKLINEEPYQGAHGKVVFSEPRFPSKVLLELYQG